MTPTPPILKKKEKRVTGRRDYEVVFKIGSTDPYDQEAFNDFIEKAYTILNNDKHTKAILRGMSPLLGPSSEIKNSGGKLAGPMNGARVRAVRDALKGMGIKWDQLDMRSGGHLYKGDGVKKQGISIEYVDK